MNCILNAFELLKTNPCQATTLVVVAFVSGLIVMCLLCKLFKPCGAKKSCGQQKFAAPTKKGEDRPFEKRKPHPAPADGSIEIYVGNLSYDMTEDQVRAEFEKFGKVNAIRLVTNKFNGKSKGFGFVQMPVREEAEKACATLNDSEVMGRKIKVNVAKNLI